MNAAAATIAALSHDGCLKGIRIKYAQECCGLRMNGEIMTAMMAIVVVVLLGDMMGLVQVT